MSMTLVPVEDCPDCGDETDETVWVEEPLLRGGGYGGAREHVVKSCGSCSWQMVARVGEIRPAR